VERARGCTRTRERRRSVPVQNQFVIHVRVTTGGGCRTTHFCSHVLCLHHVVVPLVGSFLAWLGGACNTVHFVVQTTEQVKEEWSSVAGGGGGGGEGHTVQCFWSICFQELCTGPWLTSTLWLSQVSFILFVLFCWKWKKRCVLSNLILSCLFPLSDLIQYTNEMNVNIPQLADTLFERTASTSWVVVFKSLTATNHLMVYGNEVGASAWWWCCMLLLTVNTP